MEIERIGVHAVGLMCSQSGWLFRELPTSDVGIDAMMELYNKKLNKCESLIALQIKSGSSYFKETINDCYVFRFSKRHLDYWTSYTVPVVIVLYNDDTSECVYERIVLDNVISTGENYKILISKNDGFKNGLEKDLRDYSPLSKHLYNYNYMITQLPFIEAILKDSTVILESEEWVNKSSGRGKTSVTIEHSIGETETFHWGYWFPFQMYEKVFRKIFPWADFTVDSDFYEDDDLSNFRVDNCVYDKESGNYYSVSGLSYSEYINSLPDIRYILRAGEVAFYKLHLDVNSFGMSFYNTHKHLMQLSPYNNISYTKQD